MTTAIFLFLLRLTYLVSNQYVTFITIKNIRFLKKYWYFLFLFISSFLEAMYASIGSLVTIPMTYLNEFISIYIIIEFCVFYFYFFSSLIFKHSKVILFLVFCITTIIGFAAFLNTGHFVFVIENGFFVYETILFLVLSIINMIQILEADDDVPLTQNPEFLITCGIFIFFSITFPAYFLKSYLISRSFLTSYLTNTFSDFSYMFLFLLLAKAFLCQSRMIRKF
jgi:hypothetical protein